MFIRPVFNVFLAAQSDASAPAAAIDYVIDWRWLATAEEDAASESEHSLIDWPSWARPKTPSRE